MRLNKFILLFLASIATVTASASLSIDKVSFFQCPMQGIQYDYADVYLMQDMELAKQNKTYESNAWKRNEMLINKLTDAEGRFSVWRFIPNYIEHTTTTPQRLVVEIVLLNDTALAQTKDVLPNENGGYLIPYRVRCKYRVIAPHNNLLYEKNYGWLTGYYCTQNKNLAKETLFAEQVGIQAAFSRVRQEVYAQYGFSTFEMPFALADFSQIPSIEVLQDKVLEMMRHKKGLFLSPKDKETLMAYADVLSFHKNKIAPEQQALLERNLAISLAWAGKLEALDHLQAYYTQLQTPQDSIDYRSIDLFVRYYPTTQVKYEPMIRFMQGDIKWKVDAFTYNSLISSIFSIAYPMPLFPLEEMKGEPTYITGVITGGQGIGPIYYELKYDKRHRLRSLNVHATEYEDGHKNKVTLNTMHVQYKRNSNEYERIYCYNSEFARFMMPGLDAMNQPVDAMQRLTSCKTDNLLGGFVKLKESTEQNNQFSIDLAGNVYVKGSRTMSRPNMLLKKVADANGVHFPSMVSRNTSDFTTRLGFMMNGLVKDYEMSGVSLLEKNVGEGNYAYIKADSLQVRIYQVQEETPERAGSLYHYLRMKIDTQDPNAQTMDLSSLHAVAKALNVKPTIDEQTYYLTNWWIYRLKYDDMGNWNYLQVGPYTIERNIRY